MYQIWGGGQALITCLAGSRLIDRPVLRVRVESRDNKNMTTRKRSKEYSAALYDNPNRHALGSVKCEEPSAMELHAWWIRSVENNLIWSLEHPWAKRARRVHGRRPDKAVTNIDP